MDLSERLTGHRPLDRATARVFLDALVALPANRALLAELAHRGRTVGETTPAHAGLGARIVASWHRRARC